MFEETFSGLSGYKSMWLMVMFDLPMKEDEERNEYNKFRKSLLRRGFVRLQLSVYGRFCASEESSKTHSRYVKSVLPSGG